MKKMRKVMCLLLAMVMTLSVGFAVNGTEAKAADNKLKAPKAVRCGIGAANSAYVRIPLTAQNGDVKNITVYQGKKKSKKLVVKRTYVSRSETRPYAGLDIYAKKAGKYTVKYNVYANGKKQGKVRQFVVNANGYGGALSSVTVDKKNVKKYIANYYPDTYYTSKSKIKIKFKPAAGVKIKKIEVTYINKKGKEVTKAIKNGQKVTLSQNAMYDSSKYNWSTNIWARTQFTVTYVDKYDQYNTKELKTTNFSVYRRAAKWFKEAY